MQLELSDQHHFLAVIATAVVLIKTVSEDRVLRHILSSGMVQAYSAQALVF